MKIRKLELKDAPLMLEWMHDESVVRDLKTNFTVKTLDDCVSFINGAQNDPLNTHFAIVDDADEYMGTVSLKHIESGVAEFGITIRKCAMGKGLSRYGMEKILDYGFTQLGLRQIYWCVAPENARAVRFYDKNGYQRLEAAPQQAQGYTPEEKKRFIWYEATPR